LSKLLDTIAAELERPRELSPRVLNYVTGTYGVDYDAVGAFLVNELRKLEDDDIDLLLSPLFTPKLPEQATVAEVLAGDRIPREEFPRIVQDLALRPTRAQLLTPDGQTHSVQLREVIIERYVYRLRLEGQIPVSLLAALDSVSSAATADRPTLYAIARRPAWEAAGAREILTRYLTRAPESAGYRLADAFDLLNMVETRKPANLADLLERMPAWQKALREQIDGGGASKPFFMEEIRMMHGGSRDQREQSQTALSPKERELDFLIRLQKMLA
jgi:hypothetical protein